MARMQVIASSRAIRPVQLVPAITTSLVVGFALLLGGILLGYMTLGTTFLERFTPVGRPTTGEMVAGAIAWSFALTAPALFIIVGLIRLLGVAELLAALRPAMPPAARLAGALTDDHSVALRVRLPDGRTVPELVLGPFGIAVVEQLPPAGATRRHGSVWEVRMQGGRWSPLENPLDKCARDAERVRRWVGHEEQDYVIKVYAAVVAPDESLARTPACAVVTLERLPAWIASLPAQRSLTESRRERVLDLVRAAV